MAGADPFLLLLTTYQVTRESWYWLLGVGTGRTRMRQGKVGYEKYIMPFIYLVRAPYGSFLYYYKCHNIRSSLFHYVHLIKISHYSYIPISLTVPCVQAEFRASPGKQSAATAEPGY